VLSNTLTLAGGHVAYVAQTKPKVAVVVDGSIGPPYDGIGQLVLAPDGRVAYAARFGLQAYAVVGRVQSEAWDGVAQLQLGPDGRFAYVATREHTLRLVVDGKPGAAVDEVREIAMRDDGKHIAALVRVGTTHMVMLDGDPIDADLRPGDGHLAFRPSAAGAAGPGLAYVTSTRDGQHVTVDGAKGPRYDDIRTPVWGSDGDLAYAARRGAMWSIVHRDREVAVGDAVGDPVLAGSRLAYAGRRGKRSFVVVDDTTYDFDLVFEDTVAFSRDGRHWGAVAGDVTREQLFIVIDGVRRIPVHARELYSAVASGADEATLRSWTQTELDR
jgi:hypothetical protein